MVKLCNRCGEQRAALRRPKTFEQLCKQCFYTAFEEEIHETIVANRLFRPGERVAVAASGGKDSTVLAHVLTTLNTRYSYGLDLFLLSIDEGISGYRDDSLETVKRNEAQYGIPLHVFSYKDLYGWTMDEIVAEVGTKSNCTFCGVFRRQALDRGAALLNADKVATGHNADDVAETVLLNIIRGDVPRLGRCANIITGEEGPLPRVKPFKYTYEKEIVMYAYFKKLDYFSTECVYAPFAARGAAREFVKDLEAVRPRAIIDLIRSAEQFRVPGVSTLQQTFSGSRTAQQQQQAQQPGSCERCGYLSSQAVCKACQLLEGLNSGLPRLGVGRTRPQRRPASSNGRANSLGGDIKNGTTANGGASLGGGGSSRSRMTRVQGIGQAAGPGSAVVGAAPQAAGGAVEPCCNGGSCRAGSPATGRGCCSTAGTPRGVASTTGGSTHCHSMLSFAAPSEPAWQQQAQQRGKDVQTSRAGLDPGGQPACTAAASAAPQLRSSPGDATRGPPAAVSNVVPGGCSGDCSCLGEQQGDVSASPADEPPDIEDSGGDGDVFAYVKSKTAITAHPSARAS
ncbi:hypothetical protein N2152v2_000312 [Parachlorella kessleri]